MSRALGRYELLRPLARGGMAEVFLARRKAAGVEKFLVIKRIRPERSGDLSFIDLFVREARLSMSLTHQNIVPVFDFGRIDDQVFIAMERVEGKDLGSSLSRAKEHALPHLVAAFVAAECCQALDYAHRRKSPEGVALGIVHRDVTPRNVLLSWSGEVKLTDFGIAALAGDATTKLIGTPAYMAPEQARGEPIDARADVYALGLVLRELLTGTRPRPGGEREATIAAAKAGTLVPWADGIDPRLVAIVDRATAVAAADRYSDARAMLAELDTYIVAARAATAGDAPARQLAAWLDTVWGAEREEYGEGDVAGDHLVSFLDDGALDVVGTGTERSMAATAAGEEAPAAPPPAVAEPRPVDAKPLIADDGPAAEVQRAKWLGGMRLALVGFAALAAVSLVVMLATHRSTRAAATDAGVDAEDAGRLAATPDAELAPRIDADVAAPPDAAVAIASADAAVADAPTRLAPRDAAPKIAIDAAAVIEPPPATRKVTINANPWAYVSIDGESAKHETVYSVQLAPGSHTVHFSSTTLGIEKDVTIDVPPDRDLSYVERFGR